MAGYPILQATILTQGVGFERLQHLKQGLLLTGFGQELGNAVNLLGHGVLLVVAGSGLLQRDHLIVDKAGLAKISGHQDHQLCALVSGGFEGGGIDDVDGIGTKTGVVETLAGLRHQGGQVVVTRFDLIGDPVHGARQLGGNGPLGGSQVAVARGERQPVFGPHGGHADDLDGHRHVGHHLPNKRQLLVILLAKAGHIRLYQIEQLGDDGADTAEVTRAQRPSSRLERPGTSTKVWLASPCGYMISGVGVNTMSTPAASSAAQSCSKVRG